MDSSISGYNIDLSKCSNLSMEEKRELVYISERPDGFPEILESWSRKELLEILCAEMGKERKYTGLTKNRIVQHLLRIVSEKKSEKHVNGIDSVSSCFLSNTQNSSKRQRKTDCPFQLAIGTNHLPFGNDNGGFDNAIYCQNVACKATLCPGDAFCKRCSCCICYKFDENKDPSLWLVCCADIPNEGDSCGLSCHLECAYKDERAGISRDGLYARLDGSFYCVSCRKVNDLLGCWKKQLLIAKDARRVDILCYRISLCHRLLIGTKKYPTLHEIVDAAAKKLETEVGPLNGLPIRMARGIVNRLSCSTEIHKLCALAAELVHSTLSNVSQVCPNHNIQDDSLVSPRMITFEDVSSTSLTLVLGSEAALSEEHVAYILWHRKADITEYPTEPTCTLFGPNARFSLSNLTPATEYIFKVIAFGISEELGKWEVRSMTSSVREAVTKPRCSRQTIKGNSVSSSFSGDKYNNVTYGDQINQPCSYVAISKKTEIPDLEKLPPECDLNTSIGGIFDRTYAVDHEEMAGDSVSMLDEEHVTPNSTILTESPRDSTNSIEGVPKSKNKQKSEEAYLLEMSINKESNVPIGSKMEIMPYGRSESFLPIISCKLEIGKDGSTRSTRSEPGGEELEYRSAKPEKEPLQPSGSSKGGNGLRCEEEACNREGSLERNYEYCVKVIRQIECEGYVEKNFRVKFLTWFSLRATPQERRIVNVYVNTMRDDPVSLAGQLVDTFSDEIFRKKPQPVSTGFCMKLYH